MLHTLFSKPVFIFCLISLFLLPANGFSWSGSKLDELKRQLSTAGLGAHSIQMTERGGAITLKGSVSSEQDKQRIEQFAYQVSGVRTVKNELQVKGYDNSLAGRILDAVSRSRRVGNYRVSVSESEGVVTLSGRVARIEDARELEDIARSFPEVRKVRSELEVPPPVPDKELEKRVRARLLVRSGRHLRTVDFYAKDGVVFFSGTVPRHHEIDEILSETLMVSGVLDVRSSVRIGEVSPPQFDY